MNKEEIKREIYELVEAYDKLNQSGDSFTAGDTVVPPSGKVIGSPEMKNMVEAALDGWLTTGHFNESFEGRLAEYIGVILLH